jgi:hypothetical protein
LVSNTNCGQCGATCGGLCSCQQRNDGATCQGLLGSFCP